MYRDGHPTGALGVQPAARLATALGEWASGWAWMAPMPVVGPNSSIVFGLLVILWLECALRFL